MTFATPSLLLAALLAAQATSQPTTPPTTRDGGQPAPAVTQTPDRDAPASAPATIRLATWNIENWRDHFQFAKMKGTPRPEDREHDQLRFTERFQNDEDNWEIAQVLLDPAFSPDVLVFQEGPVQADLEAFRDQWLDDAYETAIVFESNTTRDQTIGLLMKPGFTIVDRADHYYTEPDAADVNPRGERLFARGPAFVLVEAPGGYRFWVGNTHQKSKSGNSPEATVWRNAEAAMTRSIMQELRNRGPLDVVLLGDMNDEMGIQEFEEAGGGDVISNLVGPAGSGFLLATKDLAEQGAITYTGYWRPRYRSFIDHIVISGQVADQVKAVGVLDTPWARVASDHLPVYIDLRPDPAGKDDKPAGDKLPQDFAK